MLPNTDNRHTGLELARIENSFVFHARYKLNAREQKMLLYLISKLDPKSQQDFHKQDITIDELRVLLTSEDKRHGSFRERLQETVDNLVSCRISFPSEFEIDGMQFRNVINWFQYCVTRKNAAGEVYLEFAFSEILKPFLLNLTEYVRLSPAEIANMRSAFAIRMFQIFKAEFDRMGGKHPAKVRYTIDELKALLGIADKYNTGDLKDFRDRVLNKIRDEVNECATSIRVDYEYIKSSRKVTGIEFQISEKKDPLSKKAEKATSMRKTRQKTAAQNESDINITAVFDNNYRPSDAEVETLTRAKKRAYGLLVNFGVYEGIAFKQILPSIGGSEIDGFEDIFIQKALLHFQENANQANAKDPLVAAKTFVVWWHDLKIFETAGKVWAKIVEQVVAEKKKMQKNDPEAFDNRQQAKTMTNGAFETWYLAFKKEANL